MKFQKIQLLFSDFEKQSLKFQLQSVKYSDTFNKNSVNFHNIKKILKNSVHFW